MRGLTTTRHSASNVKVSEMLIANNEDGFVNLIAEDFRANELDGDGVHFDGAATVSDDGDGGCGLLTR